MNFYRQDVNEEKYIIATYQMASKTNLKDASWNLAIGQSVGNPNVRNSWETDEGVKRNKLTVVAENINLTPSGGGSNGGQQSQRQTAAASQSSEEDMPF